MRCIRPNDFIYINCIYLKRRDKFRGLFVFAEAVSLITTCSGFKDDEAKY